MRTRHAWWLADSINTHFLPYAILICTPTGQPAGGSGACVGSPFRAVTSFVSADRLDVYYLVAPRLV